MLQSCAVAYDLPQRYRAPFFYGQNLHVSGKWESLVSVRGAGGQSKSAYDKHGNTIPLTNLFGCTNLATVGAHVETACPKEKPLTQMFLSKGGIIPQCDLKRDNGHLSFSGRFKTWEVDIDYWQNIMYGLFVYGYLPVRHLEVNEICCNDCTTPDNSCAETISNFLQNDWNNVLAENGLCPSATPFCKTGIGDPAIMLGWSGSHAMPGSFLSELAGLIGAQTTFPVSSLRDQEKIFALPTGYENHWGLGFRLQAQAGVKQWFSLGFTAGTLVFLNKKKCLRMATTCYHTGPIMLERGRADVDPGQLWDIGAYCKVDRLLQGLSIMLGYSYTKQEHTRLAVLDDCFLHSFTQEQCTYGTPLNFICKDSIVQTAPQLEPWDVHTLHFMFELDLEPLLNMRFSPVVSFVYDYPFTGKRVYKTDMIGGSFGLHIKWYR